MKKLFSICVPVLLTLIAGCNQQEADQITAPSSMDTEEHGLTGQPPESIYSDIADLPYVSPAVEDFRQMGYELSLGHCFMQEAWDTPDWMTDSVKVTIHTIAMAYPADEMGRAAYVMYITSQLGTIVAPYEIVFVDQCWEPGFVCIGEGVWQKNYPALDVIGPRTHIAAVCTIYDFLDCWREKAAAGCAIAIAGCAVTGPGWGACAAAGCGVAIVASGIECAFETWR